MSVGGVTPTVGSTVAARAMRFCARAARRADLGAGSETAVAGDGEALRERREERRARMDPEGSGAIVVCLCGRFYGCEICEKQLVTACVTFEEMCQSSFLVNRSLSQMGYRNCRS